MNLKKTVIKIFKYLCIGAVLGGVCYALFLGYQYFVHKKGTPDSQSIDAFNKNLAVEVVREDMISSINFVGTTKIKNQQKLKFNSQARVVGVYKKVGDSIKKGDLIAELDKKAVLSQIEILKLNLENSQLKLKKLRDSTLDTDTKKALLDFERQKQDFENKKLNFEYFKQEQATKFSNLQESLEDKKNEYSLLQNDQKTNITQIQVSPQEKFLALQDAKTKFQTLQEDYAKELKNFDVNLEKKRNEYNNAILKEYNDVRSSILSLSIAFEDLNDIFKFKENQTVSYNYDVFFSAKNQTYKNTCSLALIPAYGYYQQLQKQFDTINDKTNLESLLSMIDVQIKMYEKLLIVATALTKGVENSIEAGDLTAGVLKDYLSLASTLYTDSNAKLIALKNLPIDLKNLKTPTEIEKDMRSALKSKKDQIETTQISLQKQENEYFASVSNNTIKLGQETKKTSTKQKELDALTLDIEKTKQNNLYEISTREKDIQSAQLALIESEKKLKDLYDTKNNQTLIIAENDVKQATISLENEKSKLDSFEIKAPFDGIVTKNDFNAGDNLASNDEKYAQVENPDILEVNIFVDQVDITKLSKKQKAIITYDAFPGVEFHGEIGDIDSTPQDKDGVTKYEVKIALKKQEQTIFSGMNANVNIVTQEKLGVLTVPFTAIKVDKDTQDSFVVVLDPDGKKTQKKVTTGYSDGTKTEILEGLQEGEKVLEVDYDANYYKNQDFSTVQ